MHENRLKGFLPYIFITIIAVILFTTGILLGNNRTRELRNSYNEVKTELSAIKDASGRIEAHLQSAIGIVDTLREQVITDRETIINIERLTLETRELYSRLRTTVDISAERVNSITALLEDSERLLEELSSIVSTTIN